MIVSHTLSNPEEVRNKQNVLVAYKRDITFIDSSGATFTQNHQCTIGTNFDAVAVETYPDIDEGNPSREIETQVNKARQGDAVGVDKTVFDYFSSQSDFDRAMLDALMSLEKSEPITFAYATDYWLLVQGRHGNPSQRAGNLFYNQVDFDVVSTAFNDATGSTSYNRGLLNKPEYTVPVRL